MPPRSLAQRGRRLRRFRGRPVDGDPRTPPCPSRPATDTTPSRPHPTRPPAPRRPWWRRRAVLTPAAAVIVLSGAYGVDLLVSSGDIPRHTVVAGVEIGGLSPADAARTLEKQLGPQIAADHTVAAGDFSTTL